VREQRLTWDEIAALGHRDLAWRIGGLSSESGFALITQGQRTNLDDPEEAQAFIDRHL
jgi:hypothetical protein